MHSEFIFEFAYLRPPWVLLATRTCLRSNGVVDVLANGLVEEDL